MLSKMLKEPLVHFLGGALLVFAFFWATGTDRDPSDYEITIDDPDTFQDRIVILMPMTRVDERLFESACHAGHSALRNILLGARAEGI